MHFKQIFTDLSHGPFYGLHFAVNEAENAVQRAVRCEP